MNQTMNDEVAEPRIRRSRAPRQRRPPEAAVADIDRLFERLRGIAPPPRVDAEWARSFGLADAPTLLTWLGLVQDGQVTDSGLWNRVRLPATRNDALRELVRVAYDGVFSQVDVSEASRDDLEGAFVNVYNLGDTRRYLRAFARLCHHAGIEVPALEVRRTRASFATVQEPRPARSTPDRPPTREPKSQRREARTDFPTAGIHVNIEIPADWTEEQVRARIAAVRRALDEAGEA
jgi:hypothetical protein